ncbi:MAG: HEPN domain-containing protein [Cyanobacteriota bacterium]|jgi:HEPN domain-containing protein
MSQARPGAWWRQARNDLDLAEMASRNGFHAQACFFATQAAEKALKGAIVELGLEPPHTHGLPKLVAVLEQQGIDVSSLVDLPLRALTRMTVTSRYPLEDTPPMDLFDGTDSAQAIATATAVLTLVGRLDQADG